jgi:predicted DCC family thiol-disulfide oxidoreductase YuxK
MEKMVLLFDSGCKLCNSSIKFVTKGDPQQKIKQITLQSTQGQEILATQPYLLDVNSIILIVNDKVFIESDAILQIAQHLSFPYKLLVAGIIVPKKWRDTMYRWIAKNRYKWFGKI